MQTLIIGDTWEFEYLITDKQGQALDLTSFAIRASILDSASTLLKIGSKEVSGGSDEQITGTSDGKLNLEFPAGKTSTTKQGSAQLEVEITSGEGKRYTIVQDSYLIAKGIITWQNAV